MGIDHLLCLTLNTNDVLKQFLGQIFPKIQLKCEGFSYVPEFQHWESWQCFLGILDSK